MPQHYALSELLIVIITGWCVFKLWRASLQWSSLACFLFGVAAALGAYRFGVASTEEMTFVHRSVAQLGGSVAMALIALEFWRLSSRKRFAVNPGIAGAISVLTTLCFGLLGPAFASIGFVFWAIVASFFAALSTRGTTWPRAVHALIVLSVLFNVLVVRQSLWLGSATAWHAFHVLMALWIYGVTYVLLRLTRSKLQFAME
ncbi:MAG: hypothetical protein AAF385_05875 [Pseudomonadota bacterium]